MPHRPRLLLHGRAGMGQLHLTAALLHHLEVLPRWLYFFAFGPSPPCQPTSIITRALSPMQEYPVHSLDLPTLLSHTWSGLLRVPDTPRSARFPHTQYPTVSPAPPPRSASSPEEACLRAFQEAQRNAPSILYWPHLDLWWETAPPTLRTSVLMLLSDIPSEVPVLLLASADAALETLPEELTALFADACASTVRLNHPASEPRTAFFQPLIEDCARITRRTVPGQVLSTHARVSRWCHDVTV